MKIFTSLMAVMFAMLLMGVASAQQPLNYLDVRDFGTSTMGQDTNDDTLAIQATLDAATSGAYAIRRVYIPAGKYYISSPLTLSGVSTDNNVEIFGDGCKRYGAYAATTSLYWRGDDGGTMFDMVNVAGLRMHDLYVGDDTSVQGMAGVLLYIRNTSSNFHLYNLEFNGAITGVKCGTGTCNSDATFTDVDFWNLTTGFEALSNQNVNFVFIRCAINNIDVGLSFDNAGTVSALNLGGANVGTGIKIRNALGGNAVYSFDCTKIECHMWKGHRTTILDAGDTTSEGVVTFTALETAQADTELDNDTPMFLVGGRMHVLVLGSIIYGRKVAVINSATNVSYPVPAWLSFRDCNFGYGCDPRASITFTGATDASGKYYAGYDMRNCMNGFGRIADTVSDFSQVSVVPAPPTNLAVTDGTVGRTTATITWTDAADENTYCVEKSLGTTWSWSTLSGFGALAQNTTSANLTGLTPNTVYWIRVVSKKASGSAVARSNYITFTTLP